MKNIVLIIFLSARFAFDASSQTVWYVNHAASGAGNGANWDDAFTNLHAALSIAQAGDAVWVAEGEYFPDAGANRAQAFILKSGVRLLGGFAGNENSPTQRDLAAHPVTLNGNIGNPADSTDNSYTILYLPYPDSSTLVDGFTFANGFAYSDTSFTLDSPVLSGGAVYVKADNGLALPTFSHCIFKNNYAAAFGGAIYVSGQNTQGNTPVFRFCEFLNNRAWRYGGGICIASGGNSYDRGMEFYHCSFIRNSVINPNGGQGGALYLRRSFGDEEYNFLGCAMVKNYSPSLSGVASFWVDNNIKATLTVDSCEFVENLSNSGSSVLWLTGPISYYEHEYYVEIKNSFFIKNKSIGTNGISSILSLDSGNFQNGNSLIFTNCSFSENTCSYICLATGLQINCDITGNAYVKNVPTYPGGVTDIIFFYSKNGKIAKNFLYKNRGKVSIFPNENSDSIIAYNNIFAFNKIKRIGLAQSGSLVDFEDTNNSAVFFSNNLFIGNMNENEIYPSEIRPPASAQFYNNIFLNNRDSSGNLTLPLRVGWDSIFLSHNLMDLDCAGLPSPVQCGTGNIFSTDALLADTASGDFRLLPCSPAINAGDNGIIQALGVTTDLDGHPRIGDGTVDIGPYESAAMALAQAPAVTGACHGMPTGSATFELANACPPFSFLWSNGVTNGTALDGLPAGDYAFSIVDSKGKVLIADVVILGSSPVLTLSGDTLSCPGFDDGQIHAELSGAEAPATFNWSNGAQGPDLLYLPPGTYSVTATDALGCADSADLAITDAPPLTALVDIQPATGPTSPTGSIHFQPTGGAAPFIHWWDTGDTLPFLGGLLPGQYGLTVSDAAGCDHVYGYTVAWVNDQTEAFASPWRLYPNPALDYVLLEGPRAIDDEALHWTLFDAAGRQVLQIRLADSKGEESKTRMLLHHLPAGIYRWELRNDKAVVNAGRLVKMRG